MKKFFSYVLVVVILGIAGVFVYANYSNTLDLSDPGEEYFALPERDKPSNEDQLLELFSSADSGTIFSDLDQQMPLQSDNPIRS
jgi:hypothetical protein